MSIQRRFGIARQQRDLALGVERDELAVIATHDDARAVGYGAQDAAAVNGNRRDLPHSVYEEHIFLGADEGCAVAQKVHGRDRRADRKRAHLVGDGNNGGGFAWPNSVITW